MPPPPPKLTIKNLIIVHVSTIYIITHKQACIYCVCTHNNVRLHIYVYYHRQWIKASISLTVVMGITWIIGFLVIEVEELFALAYIFTIFVAFQGVFIFVIFVPLSNQVQENYAKWWKAKVAESDFLSKHFGSKIFTSGTGVVSNYKLL